MNIVIIPGFIGYPEEKTFEDLEKHLAAKGHSVIKVAWPYFPDDLKKYSFTNTITYVHTILKQLDMNNTVILGFSMAGIIACHAAYAFPPRKLGLIVSPYQAGSEEDLAGKYKEWREKGYRDLISSKYGNLRIPFSFIEDARKYNALEIIERIHCPVLFIVGEKDQKVSPETTAKLYNKANKPKEWHMIPAMEHKYQYQPEMLPKVNKLIL